MSTNQWDQYADLVDERIGDGGDALHTKCIDPLILTHAGDTTGKTVVDLGCGNGYLYNKLRSPGSYIGIDYSEQLLEKAKNRTKILPSTYFILSDITKPLAIKPNIADVVVCNMVVQYLSSLEGVVSNVVSLLTAGGTAIVVLDHPAHSLFMRAQELSGKKNDKFITSASYFSEGLRKKHSLWGKATLTYYHRTIATYINAFSASLRLDQMQEVSEDGEMPRILGLIWKKL